MTDNRIKITHPEKVGVVGRCSQEQLQAHLDDGWVIKEETKTVVTKKNRKKG